MTSNTEALGDRLPENTSDYVYLPNDERVISV